MTRVLLAIAVALSGLAACANAPSAPTVQPAACVTVANPTALSAIWRCDVGDSVFCYLYVGISMSCVVVRQ